MQKFINLPKLLLEAINDIFVEMTKYMTMTQQIKIFPSSENKNKNVWRKDEFFSRDNILEQSTQVSQGNDFSPPLQSESKETHPC